MDKDVGFTQRHANANDGNDADDGNHVDDRMGVNDMNGADGGHEDSHAAGQYDLPKIPILPAGQADAQVLGIRESTAHGLFLPSSDAGRPETTTGPVASSTDRVPAAGTAYCGGNEMQRSTSGCGEPIAISITENAITIAACIAWAQRAGIKYAIRPETIRA